MAIANGAHPVAVSIVQAGVSVLIVSASAYIGNVYQNFLGDAYDRVITPKTEILRRQDGGYDVSTTSPFEFISLYPWLNSVADPSTVMVNGAHLSEYLAKNSYCLPDMLVPWTDLFDISRSFYGFGPLFDPLVLDLDGEGTFERKNHNDQR